MRSRSRFVHFALLAVPVCAACQESIIDHWGPPAGYARLTGTVTTAAGGPLAAAEVMVTQCAAPIGGLLATAQTGTDGSYHLTGGLPPQGMFLGQADSVHVRCNVFVNRSAAPWDSLEVRFAADSLARPPQVLNLVVP